VTVNLVALTVEQMVVISGDWLGKQKSLLLGISYTAPYVEDLGQVHNSVVAFLPRQSALPPEVQALIDRATVLDLRHDWLYRGCNRAFETQIYFAESGEEAAELRAMQAYYFPRGDSGSLLTYQEESGAALILGERLIGGAPGQESLADQPPNAGYRVRLQQLPATLGKTLFDKMVELAAVGRELGEVDLDKTRALKAFEESIRSSAGEGARKVQFAWIEVVKQILNGLEQAQKKGLLSEPASKDLYGPLDKAQEAIQKRSAQKRAQKEARPPQGGAPQDPSVLPPGSAPENTDS
jgi:hypothetical protein